MASGKESAGLLLFRVCDGALEVLLGHPGGPFWADRDAGAWSIPKGGLHPGEDPLDAAIREFKEETGFQIHGPFVPLGSVILKSGKRVHAWAVEGECNPAALVSNTTTVEWPPRSGRRLEIPEFDRVQYFGLAAARQAINQAQVPLLDRLTQIRAGQEVREKKN
jgi:predicted NUDIX family NTP pyrophosphohydrolase